MDQLYMLEGFLPESQCQNLALTALHVVLTVLYLVLIMLYPGVDCLISMQFGDAVQQRGHHRPIVLYLTPTSLCINYGEREGEI